MAFESSDARSRPRRAACGEAASVILFFSRVLRSFQCDLLGPKRHNRSQFVAPGSIS